METEQPSSCTFDFELTCRSSLFQSFYKFKAKLSEVQVKSPLDDVSRLPDPSEE